MLRDIDAATAAVQLLFADLQPSIVARSKTSLPKALVGSAVVLAKLGRLFGQPMHVSVVPENGKPPELVPDLAAKLSGVLQRLRVSASPFLDDAFGEALAATGRKHLIVSGVMTEVVVLHAVEAAIAAEYLVHVPVDACGGISVRTEDAAFRRIEALGGSTTSVVTLATAMAPDFSTERGEQMFAILQTLRLA